MSGYEVSELQDWDARIREKAAAFGLDCHAQEFEICDHNQMLGYMAYSGMPSHYPHWSYGKAYEKLKTLYDHGVSGLPYEMVINTNPSLAYLMRDNTLLLQILTMAHVYGHNDFFKNNFTFRSTRPEFTIGTMKSHGQRVRSYVESPSIGVDRVEAVLDAAHALSLQCRRNLAIRKPSPAEARQRALDVASPAHDPWAHLHQRTKSTDVDLNKFPLEPDEDLLLFIRDHSPQLQDWEKDLLTIVHEGAQYFIPQIETKIMNEGWATFWHKKVVESLELPPSLHLEFIVRHTQVVRPTPGGLNPYHLGLAVWQDLDERLGSEALFEAREVDRDVSFLRRFLSADLIRKLDLFEYQPEGREMVVSHVGDDAGWQSVKEALLRNVGMSGVPVIKVSDADFGQNRTLYLVHSHDGRDLHLQTAEKTLAYAHRLWRREVVLETVLAQKRVLLSYGERGFATKQVKPSTGAAA